MNKKRRLSSILPCLGFIILTLSLKFLFPVETLAEPRGEIRVVEGWRPDINVLGHNVLQYLFEYAIDRNELVPSLAVHRHWLDETTMEIHLRKGVHFHNGEPFDASAVKFNITYQREHNPGRGIQVYMQNLKEIRVIDSHTLHIILGEPDSLFLDKLILGPIAGWVIGAPKYMERVGWDAFLKRPVGTGPYMVKGEILDYREIPEGKAYATMVANPHYWKKGFPGIQRISFFHYSSNDSLRLLTEGQIDLVSNIIPKDTLKVEESPYSKVVKGRNDIRSTTGYFNIMSRQASPLRNLLVRKALNYAINKKELIRYAFKGNALEMKGLLTESSGVDLSETKVYDWNIAKARELMKEAGYSSGFDMKLFYQEKDFLIAQLIRRFYSLLKIDVDIRPMNWEWFVRHLVYPNTREGYSWDDEDWWITLATNPGYVPEIMGGFFEWASHSGAPWQTYPRWLVGPLDSMYYEVRRSMNQERRFQLYKEANDYIANQALYLFTMAPLSLYGVNKELNFVQQVSQYLYLDYSSVTDNHWSLRGKND